MIAAYLVDPHNGDCFDLFFRFWRETGWHGSRYITAHNF